MNALINRSGHQTEIDVVTDIMLAIFRLNALLLEKGDQLVAPLQLTSARWQVLGAIAMAEQPQTAPQIAVAMGITRQGAQKQLNRAVDDGLLRSITNPRHERSPLYELTSQGQLAFDQAMVKHVAWAELLVKDAVLPDLQTALRVLNGLHAQLEHVVLPLAGQTA
ncbi:MarR family winged helix-turn-helix transcriptional regulator [Chitinivorax sp. B]|uniref:MarR family winged helix-turn-helix transcriptional regulator n=1 Tax=Chitinivorax sp. B TaxID=2502235 RepID=UPI0010F78366|nr:MarR family winged helix-turn-helix transcriptional regulator [Chitinivorax sp. B]